MDMKPAFRMGAAAMLAFMPLAAAADDDSWATNEYNYASRQLTDFTNRFQNDLVDPVLRKMRRDSASTPPRTASPPRRASAPRLVAPSAAAGAAGAGAGAARPILFTPVRVPAAQSVAHRVAAAYPPQGRAQAETVFNQLLSKYAEFERMNGIPHGDLGAAVALFLGGNWMALNNRDLPDEQFIPVIGQMRASLAASPGFMALSNADKQEIYEQMVINGMFMATMQIGLRTKHDPAKVAQMQAAARGYLTQWLRADPARLQVTPKGLELAPE